jgi:hypothetical protein
MNNFTKMSVIAVVTILIIVAIIVSVRKMGVVKVSWAKPAQSSFFEALNLFGQPDILVTKGRGFAKWSTDEMVKLGYPFYKLMVKDEEVPHCCPVPHMDSMFAAIKVDAYDAAKMLAILGTSKGFWYDQGRNMLYARCCSIGTILAHFVFATDVLSRDRAAVIQAYSSQTSSNLLNQEYTNLFNGVYNPWKNNDRKAYETARDNLLNRLIANMSKLSYTNITSCEGQQSCQNILNYASVNPVVANTSICSPASTAVSLPGPPDKSVESVEKFQMNGGSADPIGEKVRSSGYDGHVFYYTQGVNPSGKQYTLGLRRCIDADNPYS